MSLNTIYITVDGNDATAQYGDPLRPFTLQGAIARINSVAKTNYWYLHIANGSYTVPCGTPLIFEKNVIVTGAGPRNTILNLSNIQIVNGVEATFSSINFQCCNNTPLFSLVSGTLALNNDEINMSMGTAFALTNGMVFVNGSVFNITGVMTNPIINVGQGGLMATNSNFNYKLNGATLAPNTSLIGRNPDTGLITLTNVNVTFALNAGTVSTPINMIPFYNVTAVNTAVVTAYGTGRETLILVATDTQSSNTPVSAPGNPVLNPPYYATNIMVNVRNFASTYMSYNMYNYPLVMSNVTWSGVATSPGPYIPSSVIGPTSPAGASLMPPPATTPPTPTPVQAMSPAPSIVPATAGQTQAPGQSRPPVGSRAPTGNMAQMPWGMRAPVCQSNNCNPAPQQYPPQQYPPPQRRASDEFDSEITGELDPAFGF